MALQEATVLRKREDAVPEDKEQTLIKGRYTSAGVDIDAGNRFVERIKPIVSKTFKSGVMTDIGGFAGVYSLNLQHVQNPVLVTSTDGVGTKLKVASLMDRHDTVGVDLVAMCVNDILVQGAMPLFFLDYLAMGTLDVEKAVHIVKGIAAGCEEAGCSLIGGETAEMPGMYAPGEYDLAGFVVGMASREDILDGSEIGVGDQILGIASNGLHSNGFSLVRKILFDEKKMSVFDHVEALGKTLGEELLTPTRIYARTIQALRRDFHPKGICHITGGGLVDNPPRILPSRCKAVIKKTSWTPPPIFTFLQEAGAIEEYEMLRTFNNGLGMLLVVSEEEAPEILQRLAAMGETAYPVGWIEGRDTEAPVQFVS